MKPIIILLLSLLPFGAFAGEPAPASAAGEPTVAELSAQLEALKARTSTWDKIAARLPRISGYVQTGYEWSETSSTFFIKRVRLNLAGDIAEKLDYRVQIEFCGPKIVDAYIRYRPFEQLNFQLGEYKLPFSIKYEKRICHMDCSMRYSCCHFGNRCIFYLLTKERDGRFQNAS